MGPRLRRLLLRGPGGPRGRGIDALEQLEHVGHPEFPGEAGADHLQARRLGHAAQVRTSAEIADTVRTDTADRRLKECEAKLEDYTQRVFHAVGGQ